MHAQLACQFLLYIHYNRVWFGGVATGYGHVLGVWFPVPEISFQKLATMLSEYVGLSHKPFNNTAGSLMDKPLGEDDFVVILQELEPVAYRWNYIGLVLGLRESTLERIRSEGQGDMCELLRRMVKEWLNMSYNYERFGVPTWRRIVEAVRANYGGRNPALADVLETKYCATSQHPENRQPVATQYHATEEIQDIKVQTVHAHHCCCCFWGPRNRPTTRIKKDLAEMTVQHPLLLDDGNCLNLSRTGAVYTINPDTRSRYSYCSTYSQSLPISLIDSEDGDLDGSQKSRDITPAAPSWEIRDIAQQRGYRGAITGREAERLLEKQGGNCYLLRYSTHKEHHVLSVQARDMHKFTLKKLHFKLNITKKGDHNVYEIDGSEEKFTDISSLLEFYKNSPLTRDRSMITIGEACLLYYPT